MAVTSKALFRGAASTTSTTLYTVPSTTTTVVTHILIANTSTSNANFDLSLDDVQIANDVVIAANDTLSIDLKQVLSAAKTIKGSANVTSINFHISGVEIV